MFKKTKITEGCYTLCSDNTSIMFGCPSDIIKVFTSKHLDIPYNIVLPDIFFQNGINVLIIIWKEKFLMIAYVMIIFK